MPPKGWRKNGESAQINRDTELVSIDDILFPRLTILKLAKGVLASDTTDNMSLAKDSLLAVQRSATVFVSHLMFHARQIAKAASRKNVTSLDILAALEKADLSGFVPEVKQRLSTFEAHETEKKKQKAARGDEPAAKKLKDNSAQGVEVDTEAEAEAESHDEHVPEDDEEDADEDEDEDETPAKNPIALLAEEQDELEGAEPAEPDEHSDED